MAQCESKANELLVPIVLWSQRPPQHRVSAVLVTRGRRVFVTGSYSGQLCLWRLSIDDNEPQCEPRLLLIGHTRSITALCECTVISDDASIPVVISASEDGSICSWGLQDGRCLAVGRPMTSTPKQLQATQSGREFICSGNSVDIHIIDAKTLQCMRVLRSEARPNWCSGICVCDIATSGGGVAEGLISLSVDGTLHMWSLAFLNDEQHQSAFGTVSGSGSNVDTPLGASSGVIGPNNDTDAMRGLSTPLRIIILEECNYAVSVDAREDNVGLILVVTTERWRVFALSSYKEISRGSCPNVYGWAGGRFAGPGRILMWGKGGVAYLYSLPAYEKQAPLAFSSSGLDPTPSAPISRGHDLPPQRPHALDPRHAKHLSASASYLRNSSHGTNTVYQNDKVLSVHEYNSRRAFGSSSAAHANMIRSMSGQSVATSATTNSPATPIAGQSHSSPTSPPPPHSTLTSSAFNTSPVHSELLKNHPKVIAFSRVPSANALLPGSRRSSPGTLMTILRLPDAVLEREFRRTIEERAHWTTNCPSTLQMGSFPIMDYAYDMLVCGDGTASLRVWLVTKEVLAHDAPTPPAPTAATAADASTLPSSLLGAPVPSSALPRSFRARGASVNLPIAEASLAGAWDRCSDQLCDLTGPSDSPVSCTIMADRRWLVRGYESGLIILSTATAMFHDWMGRDVFADEEHSSDDDDNDETGHQTSHRHVFLRGHTGRITALLCPSSNTSATPATASSSSSSSSPHPLSSASSSRRLLVSGSTDLTVRVWRMSTGECTHTFGGHVGVIDRLVYAPGALRDSYSCVMALSRDHSVSVYSLDEHRIGSVCRLGGHTFPVDAVGWRRNDGYIVCRCTDGSVYVWQLGSGHEGHLDRHESGSVGEDIFDSCDGWGFMSHANRAASDAASTPTNSIINCDSVADGSLELLSLPIVDGCPQVQLIVVDVQQLIVELLQSRLDLKPPMSDEHQYHRNLSLVSQASVSARASGEHARNVARLILSFLLSWGIHDDALRARLGECGMFKPARDVSIGLIRRAMSHHQQSRALVQRLYHHPKQQRLNHQHAPLCDIRDCASLPVPCIDNMGEHWQRSAFTTATHSMSIVAIAQAMMNQNSVEIKAGWSDIITNYTLLADTMADQFEHPSIPVLMDHWQDPIVDIRAAARSLLLSSFASRSPAWRSSYIERLHMHMSLARKRGESASNSAPANTSSVVSTDSTTHTTNADNVHHQEHVTHSLLLGVLAAYYGDSLSDATIGIVSDTLMQLLQSNTDRLVDIASAAEMLARGFPALSSRICAPDLIRRLIQLTSPRHTSTAAAAAAAAAAATTAAAEASSNKSSSSSSASQRKKSRSPASKGSSSASAAPLQSDAASSSSSHSASVSSTNSSATNTESPDKMLQRVCRDALMTVATCAPQAFVQAVTKEVMQSGSEIAASVVRVIRSLIKMKPAILESQLPRLVELVVRCCLDPHHVAQRQALLVDSTALLMEMIQVYNTISFHQPSQRLAIGMVSGAVVIYDISTATRAHVFDTHTQSPTGVTALALSPDGKHLGTYSHGQGPVPADGRTPRRLVPRTLRLWHISSGLFGLLGTTPKLVRETHVPSPPDNPRIPPPDETAVRVVWVAPRKATLVRDGKEIAVLSV